MAILTLGVCVHMLDIVDGDLEISNLATNELFITAMRYTDISRNRHVRFPRKSSFMACEILHKCPLQPSVMTVMGSCSVLCMPFTYNLCPLTT